MKKLYYLAGIVLLILIFAIVNKENLVPDGSSENFSCTRSNIPSIGMTAEYEEYSKNFKTFTEDNFGFSFRYPQHLEVFVTQEIGNHIVLAYPNDTNDEYGKIIVSIGLNDENMTPEDWLLGPNSGYAQSKDRYGDCHKTTIGGQEAIYTDGGMWTIVNTPDNRYRLSIADLTTGEAQIPFTEMGIVVGSLGFPSPTEH